jgi:hypothetical protein
MLEKIAERGALKPLQQLLIALGDRIRQRPHPDMRG